MATVYVNYIFADTTFFPFRAYVLTHHLNVDIISLLFGYVPASCSRWSGLMGVKQRGRNDLRCDEIMSDSNVLFQESTPLFKNYGRGILEFDTGSSASVRIRGHLPAHLHWCTSSKWLLWAVLQGLTD